MERLWNGSLVGLVMQEKLLGSYLVRVSKHKCQLRLYLLNLNNQEQLEFKTFGELSDFIERSSLSPPKSSSAFKSDY